MLQILTNETKALYVIIRTSESKYKMYKYMDHNCLVFNPMMDRTHNDAMNRHSDFIKSAQTYEALPIVSKEGPCGIGQILAKEYNAKCNFGIGGMMAKVNIPKKNIDKLISDLTKNPVKYLNQK